MPLEFAQPPQRILIVKPSAIGDIVHTLPVLNLLRKRFPAAHIAWLVTPACRGILDGHPQLNEIIPFERKRWTKSLSLMKRLHRERFDLGLDLQGLFRSGLFAWSTGAPVRVGFANAREMAPLFYTHDVPVPEVEVHAMDRYLALAEAVGCERGSVEYVFPTDAGDRDRVAAMLGGAGAYAVLLPGTNWATKRWPAEHFAGVVAPLRERFGLSSVIAGGPGDGDAVAALAPSAINLAGRTSLRELMALQERASLVIANDSGPMHIAAALGRPLVTVFGPTNPVRTGPYQRAESVLRVDLPCSPCYSKTCSHQSCLRWLTIEPVMELARQQMGLR
jgi:lipopolysaccharide heptosyltransferase I